MIGLSDSLIFVPTFWLRLFFNCLLSFLRVRGRFWFSIILRIFDNRFFNKFFDELVRSLQGIIRAYRLFHFFIFIVSFRRAINQSRLCGAEVLLIFVIEP